MLSFSKYLLDKGRFLKRNLALRRNLSQHEIRRKFFEYFVKQNEHNFVRSSSVVPDDATLTFVNAGMNQFKNVFLNKAEPRFSRVVNSQKCIRLDGKHNDLSVVGTDGYHHTFFEMLGNWSFGDYFKEDACKLAWNLLIGPYNIHPSRLYVTYFGGDESMKVPADEECLEIWRKVGVPNDRIIPFGSTDNFWDMGLTGPCGPCTEIHIDHLPNSDPSQRARFVNAGVPDLTELWNLVFIQYSRSIDGTLTPLPKSYVDTGMGMERLAAILQGKSSNYDTDLFTPILDTISQASKMPGYQGVFDVNDPRYEIDRDYRVLADHARMVSVCLADGMFPNQNQKLRRALRRALKISENTFKKVDLLQTAIVPKVVEVLGDTYPELQQKQQQITDLILCEMEQCRSAKVLSRQVRKILAENPNLKLEQDEIIDFPGFEAGFKHFEKLLRQDPSMEVLAGKDMFQLNKEFGLSIDLMEQLAASKNLSLDHTSYAKCVEEARLQMKKSSVQSADGESRFVNNLKARGIADTDDNLKYSYEFLTGSNSYSIPEVRATVLALDRDATDPAVFRIVADKSNFYHTAGGQECDTGRIVALNDPNVVFIVQDVTYAEGYVIHRGTFADDSNRFAVSDDVRLIVDETRRTRHIQHHSATHLLHEAVRLVTNKVTYQSSSTVDSQELKLELSVYGANIHQEVVQKVENLVRQVINSGVPVQTDVFNSEQLYESKDVTLVPGKLYPAEGIRILTIASDVLDFKSREACCGTHVRNTKELIDFCITQCKPAEMRQAYIVRAVAGEEVKEIFERGQEFQTRIRQLAKAYRAGLKEKVEIEAEIKSIRKLMKSKNYVIPHSAKVNGLSKLADLEVYVKKARNPIIDEMLTIIEECSQPFITHVLSDNTRTDPQLGSATNLCTDRPILIIAGCGNNEIKARAQVPADFVHERFSAEIWLNELGKMFGYYAQAPRGHDAKLICNLTVRDADVKEHSRLLAESLRRVNEYAVKNFTK